MQLRYFVALSLATLGIALPTAFVESRNGKHASLLSHIPPTDSET
jgi:hypothetical protein